MLSTPLPPPDEQETKNVAWPEVIRFVQQLSHDLRNNLNSLELQLTLLNELADNPELQEDVQRSRETVAEMAGALQKLTSTMVPGEAHRMPYGAANFLEDLRKRIESDFPEQAGRIVWKVELGEEELEIDPVMMIKAVLNLVANAFQFAPAASKIAGHAKIDGGHFVLELREPKDKFDLPTDNWGARPLRGGGRGHYGLGLYHAREIIEGHQGKLKADFDSATSALLTTVKLPVIAAGR